MNLEPAKYKKVVEAAADEPPGFVLVSPLVVTKVYRTEEGAREDAERLAISGNDTIVARIVAVYRKPKPG